MILRNMKFSYKKPPLLVSKYRSVVDSVSVQCAGALRAQLQKFVQEINVLLSNQID